MQTLSRLGDRLSFRGVVGGCLFMLVGASGCATKPIQATQAPKAACSVDVLDAVDAPDSMRRVTSAASPGASVLLPALYEAIWQEDANGTGRWSFRLVSDAERRLHPNLKPALLNQEIGIVLAHDLQTQQRIIENQGRLIQELRGLAAASAKTEAAVADLAKRAVSNEAARRQSASTATAPAQPGSKQ